MSRIGKSPVKIPSGVNVTIDDNTVKVIGTKGELIEPLLPYVSLKQENEEIIINRVSEEPISRANHGLMRSLVNNMVVGVSSGFEKKLEVNGVGYRVNLAGSDLRLSVGFSHEVVYKIPVGVSVKLEQNVITVSGSSKQKVGQVAAEIRSLKKPEPYKGKGIMYVGERIIRKSGKSGKEK